MQVQLGTAKLSDYPLWERIKIILFATEVMEDINEGWEWRRYKVYKDRMIIIGQGRY